MNVKLINADTGEEIFFSSVSYVPQRGTRGAFTVWKKGQGLYELERELLRKFSIDSGSKS